MHGGQFDLRRDDALPRPAHERAVGAGAEREAEGIEEDRFAGTRFAGQHSKARLELELEPLDQNHIGTESCLSMSAK